MNASIRNQLEPELSRREFVRRTAIASAALAATAIDAAPETSAQAAIPIVVFSKVYQELKLNFEESASLTGDAGLDGVDATVRANGEVPPDRVEEDLPLYVEALQKRKLRMPMITTGIVSIASPKAEEILRTARKCGVKYYRIGFIEHRKDVPREKLIAEARAHLKELALLNKQLGLCALVQNHSPSGGKTYLAGDLAEMRQLLADFDPDQVGMAFDIGHALSVHGMKWREHFEKIKSCLRIVYVKDAIRSGRWVTFGQGEIGATGFFEMLLKMGYRSPISMHVEFDWAAPGKKKDRTLLLETLRSSLKTLRGWLAHN